MVEELNVVEFQDVIARFINKMGFEIESSKILDDGSIDFKSITKNPMGAKITSLIRASPYSRLVNEADISSLYARMTEIGGVRAAYITTSGFSDNAIESAKDKPISLINKYQLIDSIEKRGLLSDKDLMQSLEGFGMGEKHFQGREQSFESSKSLDDAKVYFERKASKKEKVSKITLRYAPLEVFRVDTIKNVWTDDQTLRTIEKKDYLLVNLNNLDLYYIFLKREKNRTERSLMRSDILRKIMYLPETSKESLMHLLEHGDLPVEAIEELELSILKNKKVIDVYEVDPIKSELWAYIVMFLEGAIEAVYLAVNEIITPGSTSTSVKKADPLKKKVKAAVNMPHLWGGIYDLWKYLDTRNGLSPEGEIDPLKFTSKEIGSLLAAIFNGKIRTDGIIFMPYYRGKYKDLSVENVTKYEVLYSPRFKQEPTASQTKEVPKTKKIEGKTTGPRIKGRQQTSVGKFRLIK